MSHPRGAARWGEQIDIQVLDDSCEDTTKRVSGYVAKYATKSSDGAGVLDSRIRSAEDLARRHLPAHLRAMAEVAWALGGEAAVESLHLRRHAHGLGYGGHFLSKSRHYSTTLGALKAARAAWREAMRRGGDAGETADRSLERRLRAVGVGWTSRGEELWAGCQQRQRREERRLGNEEWYSRTEQDMEQWGSW